MSAIDTRSNAALANVDNAYTVSVLSARVFLVGQAWYAARIALRRARHPKVLVAGLGVISAQSAWAGVRGLRRGSVRDRAVARSDAAMQIVALVTEAVSWGSRSMPPDPRWSETFGVVVAGWLPFESVDRFTPWAALAAWAATYLATMGSESTLRDGGTVRGQRMNELGAQVAYTMVGGAFARQVLGQASQLDRARAEGTRQSERLATERERQRHYRMIHDSALQLFEAVAGDFTIDDELLEQRIEFEASRLRLELAGAVDPMAGDSAPVVTMLAPELLALAAEFALLGLEVSVVADGTISAPRVVVEALRDAAREALMNVHKHAGVNEARVWAEARRDGWEVTVVDDGRGFDPCAVESGFGLAGSIHERLRELGGVATVRSARGEGTQLALWVPVGGDGAR